MAKRSRGTANRPGQRRPIQRPASRPTSSRAQVIETRRPDTLSEEEEARAAELEAGILAEEKAAEASRARTRERARPSYAPEAPVRGRMREAGISVRAAEEYTYVARDVRRIARVGGSMVAIMAVLFVLLEVVHVVQL